MSLPDVPADVLARIDAVCLNYESMLRRGSAVSIDSLVDEHAHLPAELLQRELELVQRELSGLPESPQPQSHEATDATDGSTKETNDSEAAGEANAWEAAHAIHHSVDLNDTQPPTVQDNAAAQNHTAKQDNAAEQDKAAAENDPAITENSVAEQHAAPPHDRPPHDRPPQSDREAVPPDATQVMSPPAGGFPQNPLPPHRVLPHRSGRDAQSQSAVSLLPPPGAALGPYEIEERIDQGGMGVVYRAIDIRLRRQVAIKVLSPHLADRKDLVERFDRENHAVAKIMHPGVVELFDVGRYGKLPYAVMEFLRGTTLAEFMQRGAMSPPLVRRIGIAVGEALATAHAAGVIHRDLKPQNVMLLRHSDGSLVSLENGSDAGTDPSGDSKRPFREGLPSVKIKVFDFGLSRIEGLADPAQDIGAVETLEHGNADPIVGDDTPAADKPDDATLEGTVMGTPGFMAPEQIQGQRVTPKADLFALGAILFQALNGRPAFPGATRAEKFRAGLTLEPEFNESALTAAPELAQWILKCLEKDPRDRPESAAKLVEELRRGEQEHYTVHVPWRPSRRAVLAIAGTSLGAVGTAWGIGYFQAAREIGPITRLAVLKFRTGGETESISLGQSLRQVVGDRPLKKGERIASLLIHELSRLPNVELPAFKPVSASNPEEYVELAGLLGVQAILDGEVTEELRGKQKLLLWTLRLVDGETGNIIWEATEQTVASESILEQTRIAQEVARRIGQRLVPTGQTDGTPKPNAFACLIDGKAHADPDSIKGLTEALVCYLKASERDPFFTDALEGIATQAISLAHRVTGKAEFQPLMTQAVNHAEKALKLEPDSFEGLLVQAIHGWQALGRFAESRETFKALLKRNSKDPLLWQHLGYLQQTLGQDDAAMESLKQARLLSPLSKWIAVEEARVTWFAGQSERAITMLRALRKRFGDDAAASGLLIDIYEADRKWPFAAAIDRKLEESAQGSAAIYGQARKPRLVHVPYGPFADLGNELIWLTRFDAKGLANRLDDLLTPPLPPLMRWLLAKHPGMKTIRQHPAAKYFLPSATHTQTA
ncbi:MAG: protein kinase [Planctomycetota bacterium]